MAAALLLLFGALNPREGRAAAFGTQGIPAGAGATPAELDATFALARRAGAKLFRVEADWAALEPGASGVRDPAALAQLDAVVAAARRHAIKTLLFVDRTPCWASSSPDRGDCTAPDANREAVWRYQPADPSSVIPLSTFLAARYAADLAAFQIWNEPDQANEKYWAGPDKAVNYVAMVKALYGPLKRAAPKVPVLAGSFVGGNGNWLRAMYRRGRQGLLRRARGPVLRADAEGAARHPGRSRGPRATPSRCG